MSAPKPPRRGVFTGITGILGFSALSGLLVTVMIAPALAVTGITASSTIGIFDSLPEYIEIGQQPERNTLYAQYSGEGSENGYIPIATIYDQNRQEVPYDQISSFALDAAVAGEDRRFWEHGGVDVPSVIRAAVGNATGTSESGASTLSMQLVKNIYVQQALQEPTEELRQAAYDKAVGVSFDRKLKEMKLAIGLEKAYTKKEILTAYLNIAFFGDNTYGIQSAAQRYYSVDASELTLPQAASLIAIVQFPNQRGLDVPENYDANKARRDVILYSMLDVGDITQSEYDDAIATPVDDTTLLPSEPSNGCLGANRHAKWFCDYVVKNVKNFEFLGANEQERADNWKRGGYSLYTTLDLDIQITAQEAQWQYVNPAETALALGGATVSVQPGTGRVLAMAENKIFDDTLEGGGPSTSAVNYNTGYEYGGSSGMQSGSTYKLFTLLDWLKSGKGIYERVNGNQRTENQAKFKDSCTDGGGPWGGPYPFKNDSGGSPGAIAVYDATVGSVNGAFISMALQLDQCNIRGVAESLGVERADGNVLQTNPSSVLGTNEVTPLSMAGAYAAVAAGGKYCKPIVVDRVLDPNGKDIPGQTSECRQAIAPEVAATAAFALAGVMSGGTGSASNPGDGIPIIGKTGTTDNAEQTWIITATTQVATAVWVGNSIGKVSLSSYDWAGISGSRLRHAIMNVTMVRINQKYGGLAFPAPDPSLLTGSGLQVPDIRGLSPEAAKALLEGLGFIYADGGQIDSEIEAGKVASTDPPIGTLSARDTTITVFTSKGNKVSFPDVVGDGQSFTYGAASGQLNSEGFSDVSQICSALPPGTLPGDPRIDKVSASDPSPGAFVLPNAKVKLTVTKLACP
ncbi:MAG: transglycosylase domain-containing protein [Rhodoglobus sp.]